MQAADAGQFQLQASSSPGEGKENKKERKGAVPTPVHTKQKSPKTTKKTQNERKKIKNLWALHKRYKMLNRSVSVMNFATALILRCWFAGKVKGPSTSPALNVAGETQLFVRKPPNMAVRVHLL